MARAPDPDKEQNAAPLMKYHKDSRTRNPTKGIRCQQKPMRVQGLVVEDPLFVNDENYETAIFDKKNKNSIWCRSNTQMRRHLSRITESMARRHPALMEKKAKVDEVLMRLKFAFWEEYQRAQDKNVYVNVNNVVRGICSKEYWYLHVSMNPDRLLWVVVPPSTGLNLYKRLMFKAFERLNDILDLPLERQQSVTVREPYMPGGRPPGKKAGRPKKEDLAQLEKAEVKRTDQDSKLHAISRVPGWPMVYRTTTKTLYAIDAAAISEIRKTAEYVEKIVRGQIRHMLKVVKKESDTSIVEEREGKQEPGKEYAPSAVEDVEETLVSTEEELEQLDEAIEGMFEPDDTPADLYGNPLPREKGKVGRPKKEVEVERPSDKATVGLGIADKDKPIEYEDGVVNKFGEFRKVEKKSPGRPKKQREEVPKDGRAEFTDEDEFKKL